MKTTNKLTSLFSVALLTLMGMSPAHALLITVNYTGTVNAGSGGAFAQTVLLFGTYTFDSLAMDQKTSGGGHLDKGEYVALTNSFIIKDSTNTTTLYSSLEGTTPLLITTENGSNDKYKFDDTDQTGRNPNPFDNTKAFSSFKIDLKGPNTVFSNADFASGGFLPLTLNLGDFNAGTDRKWELKFSGSTTTGTLTSLTMSAVPVPAAVWLMGSALLGLVGIGRRKKAV